MKTLNKDYKLIELGFVQGNGLNDNLTFDKSKEYNLRRLEYGDKIVLERMVRQTDCDADDIIESKEFEKGKEPKDWPLEITFDNETGEYMKGGDDDGDKN